MDLQPEPRRAIRSFRDLDVYQMAREASFRVFVVTKDFLKDEKWSLIDQVRRSAGAVSGMIAEAWARRRYQAAFIDKLNQAQGEAAGTQAWFDHALDAGFLSHNIHAELDTVFQNIGGKLERMINKADTFCR
jgi:four helix bundle protein